MSFDETSPCTGEEELPRLAIIKSGKSKGKICLVLSTSDYILSDNLKIHTVLEEKSIFKYVNINLSFIM